MVKQTTTAGTTRATTDTSPACPTWCQYQNEEHSTDHWGVQRKTPATASLPWIDEGATYSSTSVSAYKESEKTQPHVSVNMFLVAAPFESKACRFEGDKRELEIAMTPDEAVAFAKSLLATAQDIVDAARAQ